MIPFHQTSNLVWRLIETCNDGGHCYCSSLISVLWHAAHMQSENIGTVYSCNWSPYSYNSVEVAGTRWFSRWVTLLDTNFYEYRPSAKLIMLETTVKWDVLTKEKTWKVLAVETWDLRKPLKVYINMAVMIPDTLQWAYCAGFFSGAVIRAVTVNKLA